MSTSRWLPSSCNSLPSMRLGAQTRRRGLFRTSSTKNHRNAKTFRRTYTVVQVATGFVVCMTILQYVGLWSIYASTTVRLENANKLDSQKSPAFLHTPPVIALNLSKSRHSCLVDIRKRHKQFLERFIPDTSVLLVDPAYHSNVGDVMITEGELTWLENTDVGQCSYVQAGSYVPPCKIGATMTNQSHPAAAVWHGGGNWGDLWRRAQTARIDSFVDLLRSGYTVVTMPNSWYYGTRETELRDVQQIRDNIASGLGLQTSISNDELRKLGKDRVIFSWREQSSFELSKVQFPFVTNDLVPDIAFQLGPYNAMPPERKMDATDVLVLLRDDHESVHAKYRNRKEFQSLLETIQETATMTFSIVDWSDRMLRFESQDVLFSVTAIQLLSLGTVVICDRLHAAILAYLAGLPFVYLDQITGKITKVFTAAMDSGPSCKGDSTWMRALNMTDAVEKAALLVRNYGPKKKSRRARRQAMRGARQNGM